MTQLMACKKASKGAKQQTHMAGGREGKMEGFVKTSPQATVDKIERERERERENGRRRRYKEMARSVLCQ
jgi:hypothetical protein